MLRKKRKKILENHEKTVTNTISVDTKSLPVADNFAENVIKRKFQPEDEEVEVQTDLGMYPILYHPYLHMIIDHFVYTYIFICTLIYHRVSASGDYIFQ